MALNIENIWKEYRERLFQFIKKRVSNLDTAEDIIQNIFLKIYDKIDSLQSKEKLQSWLYQITRNTIIDYYRDKKTTVEISEDLPQPIEEASTKALRELSECLIPMINKLPAHYKDAIILSELKGMTHKEISHAQGISLSGSISQVQRGRGILKKMLTDCCQFEFDHSGRLYDYEQKSKSCVDC